MRYVIIPLAILAYLIWIILSIREIKKCKWKPFNMYLPFYAAMYVIVHLAAIIVAILYVTLNFIIKYW